MLEGGVSFNKADLDVVRNCIKLNSEEILKKLFDIVGIVAFIYIGMNLQIRVDYKYV